MRAIWTGAIGFGLVNIPVRIFSAVQDSNLDLDMLDKKDHGKVRFKRVNEDSGKEVPWENIVKAYDYNGKYVILEDEDFKQASPEKSKIIEILEFVKETDIESIFYETPYFLEPQKSGQKAYMLLREALKKIFHQLSLKIANTFRRKARLHYAKWAPAKIDGRCC